jgi:hypothetical protein
MQSASWSTYWAMSRVGNEAVNVGASEMMLRCGS